MDLRHRLRRAIHARNVANAETAAREMGHVSLADALALCEFLAAGDPKRFERAALRWLTADAASATSARGGSRSLLNCGAGRELWASTR